MQHQPRIPKNMNRAWVTCFEFATLPHCDEHHKKMYLYFSITMVLVLTRMIQLWWLLFKPCDVSIFDSEVLNLKCYTGPLILGQAYISKGVSVYLCVCVCVSPKVLPFIWMDLQIQTLTTWGIIKNCGPRTKRIWWEQRPQECPYQLKEETRDSHSWHTGRVHSLTHCTRKTADWAAFSNGT